MDRQAVLGVEALVSVHEEVFGEDHSALGQTALASARGFRYLQVDASADSRPILQRLGFVELATTTPFTYPGATVTSQNSTAGPLRRNRDFVLLQGGQLLSSAGSESTAIAYPLLVLALTQSPAKAGLVAFARVVPFALFGLLAGMAADRFDRSS